MIDTWKDPRWNQDYVLLDGKRTPGVATIHGHGRRWKFDDKESRGSSDGHGTFVGEALVEFEIRITLFSDADLAAWDEFKLIVDTPPGGRAAKAIAIDHPLTADRNIPAITVREVMGPEQDGDVLRVTIKVKQWRKPKPQIAQLKSSKSGTEKERFNPWAEDEGDREIRRLLGVTRNLNDDDPSNDPSWREVLDELAG